MPPRPQALRRYHRPRLSELGITQRKESEITPEESIRAGAPQNQTSSELPSTSGHRADRGVGYCCGLYRNQIQIDSGGAYARVGAVAATKEVDVRQTRKAPPLRAEARDFLFRPCVLRGYHQVESEPKAEARIVVPPIVNESFVYAYFARVDAIGQPFGANGPGISGDPDTVETSGWTIVGVVRM